MPYTKDGRRVDLMLNMLAVINRTTSAVLSELFITGCAYKVRLKMKELPTYKEKEKLLLDFIGEFSEKEMLTVKKDIEKLKGKAREKYIDDTIEDGIYIHQPPIGEDIPIFYRCINCRKKFDFLQPDDVYIRKYGREIKMLQKQWVGSMYIVKLNLTSLNPLNCWKVFIE